MPLFIRSVVVLSCICILCNLAYVISRVDQLYAFFIQWKSEAYDNDELCNDMGFVAVTDPEKTESETETGGDDPSRVTSHLGRQISLDWEVTLHIRSSLSSQTTNWWELGHPVIKIIIN